MNYASLLKQLRGELVLSQTEMAKKLGCCFASVNRWENGIHEPNFQMKRRILSLCKKHGILGGKNGE